MEHSEFSMLTIIVHLLSLDLDIEHCILIDFNKTWSKNICETSDQNKFIRETPVVLAIINIIWAMLKLFMMMVMRQNSTRVIVTRCATAATELMFYNEFLFLL